MPPQHAPAGKRLAPPDSPRAGSAAPTQPLLSPLHLDGIAQGGESVARHEGRVIFVQGGLPGEVVAIRLTEVQKRYARGVVVQVLSPAPDRREPCCPLFGRCGGCHWQYIAYPAQLALKRTIVEEQCRHVGRIAAPPVAPAIGMEEPLAYRSTAELHLTPAGEVGYFAGHSHTVVPLERCPLLVPTLNALLPALAAALQQIPPADRPTQVTLRNSSAERCSLVLLHGGTRRGAGLLRDRLAALVPEIAWQHGRLVEVLAGRGFFFEELEGHALRVSPTSFFQVNLPQAGRLLQTVQAFLAPQPTDHLVDAYAGVGALSLPLAGQVERVTAIESHPAAVADLRENAGQLAPAGRVVAIAGLVEEALPDLLGQPKGAAPNAAPGPPQSIDLVLLDPPRRGCLPPALKAIRRARPRRIVYVSCHPGTLARDLRDLLAGGYALRQVQPLDLFPQTFHVESVALLEREG